MCSELKRVVNQVASDSDAYTVGVLLWGTMINHNAGIGDCSIPWDVASVSLRKKKMVVVPLVMLVHPCVKGQSSLFIALSHRSLSRGSLIKFL